MNYEWKIHYGRVRELLLECVDHLQRLGVKFTPELDKILEEPPTDTLVVYAYATPDGRLELAANKPYATHPEDFTIPLYAKEPVPTYQQHDLDEAAQQAKEIAERLNVDSEAPTQDKCPDCYSVKKPARLIKRTCTFYPFPCQHPWHD